MKLATKQGSFATELQADSGSNWWGMAPYLKRNARESKSIRSSSTGDRGSATKTHANLAVK